MEFEFTNYARKPFTVEAVEITEENLADIANTFHIGDVKETDSGKPCRPYILVDRRVVPNIFRVYPGFFMTRLGDQIRCYSPKIFREQFTVATTEIMSWVDFMNNGGVENSRTATTVELSKATPAS